MTSVTETVDKWITSGLFETTPQGLRPSEGFRTTVADKRSTVTAADVVNGLPDDLQNADVDPDVLATYMALRESDPDVSSSQALVLSVLLNSDEAGSPPTAGAPEGFLPVHGPDASRLIDLCDRCVVYVWREDCSPCDGIRSRLETVFGYEPPEGVLALSVYGPDAPDLLRERYNVVGAPTTLFTLAGSVDARFVGVADAQTIEREIDTLRDRTV